MKDTRFHYLLLAFALVFAGLSCKFAPGFMFFLSGPVIEDIEDEIPQPVPESTNTCDATKFVPLQVKLTRNETNEFNTVLREFDIHYVNTHPGETIFLYAYIHRTDIWQKMDKSEWTLIDTLAPGAADTRKTYTTKYDDKDAQGTTMYMLEKIAGLFKTPECEKWKGDAGFFTEMGREVIYPEK